MNKYLIGIPALDMMPTATTVALTQLKRVGVVKHSFICNSLVSDARNMIAKQAIESDADRILFIDSDMYFEPDAMQRLEADMDNSAEMVCGLYFKRMLPTEPCIYKTAEIVQTDKGNRGHIEAYTDYPKDSVFEVEACGFGLVMVDTDLIIDVAKNYGAPFNPYMGLLGEDISFCYRARQLGHKIYCDSSIKVGHVGQMIYGENQWLAQNEKTPG